MGISVRPTEAAGGLHGPGQADPHAVAGGQLDFEAGREHVIAGRLPTTHLNVTVKAHSDVMMHLSADLGPVDAGAGS